MSLLVQSLKQAIRLMTSSVLLKKKSVVASMVVVLFWAIQSSSPAYAGGGLTGGATEITQLMNNTQLVLAYSKQLEQYATQLQQYAAELKHLEQNPQRAMNTNPAHIIQGVGEIMSAQNSMGATMARIDANFAQKFGSPVAGSLAEQFRTWTETSVGTLGAAMRAAGLHRDSYATDTQALQALYNQSQQSAGTVAAVQQLSALTTMQVQQTQKLSDLMATQNIAVSTHMAAQASKEQANDERAEAITGRFIEAPTRGTGRPFEPLRINSK